MKILAIIAVVLGVAAIGANIYAVVETKPNYDSMTQMVAEKGPMTKHDIPLIESYRGTLKNLAYTAFGTGVLALILGVVAGIKREKLGFVGAAMGVAGFVWQFLWAV